MPNMFYKNFERSIHFSLRFYTIICTTLVAFLLPSKGWSQSTRDGRSAALAVTGTVVDDEGTYLERFVSPELNDAGQVLIRAIVENVNGVRGQGYFLSSGTGNDLTTIVISGQDLGDGNTLSRALGSHNKEIFNNLGEVAFLGELNDDSDDQALFLGSSQGLTRLARVNDPVPHENGGILGQQPTSLDYHLLGNPQLNDAGQVSFTGGIKDGDDNARLDIARLGAFRASTSGVTGIAREFQSISIAGDDATLIWNNPTDSSGRAAAGDINSAGQVLFSGRIRETGKDDYSGVFVYSGGQVVRATAAGDSIPGSNETLKSFSHLYLDDSGGSHFASLLNDAGGEESGRAYFYASSSELTQLARTGQLLADGNTLDTNRLDQVTPQHNESGQVAFYSVIRDTNENFIATGLFVAGEDELVEIVRCGDDTPDGDGQFSIASNAHERIIGLNDAGVVAFRDSLTDAGNLSGTGIFLSDGIDTVTVVRRWDEIDGDRIRGLNQAPNLGDLNNFGQVIYENESAEDVIYIFTPDLHYRADGNGSFDEGDNWTLSLDPGDPHDTFFATDTDITVTAEAGSRKVNSLEIGGGEGLATFNLSQGASIEVAEQVTVLEGGMLGVEGVVVGDVINTGGILAPGTSPGTFNLAGDLTITGDSDLEIELGGTVQGETYDLLSQSDGITGVSLGGTLTVRLIDDFASSITSDDSFTVLTSDNPLIGTFTNIASNERLSISGGSFLVTYGDGSASPNQVVLSDFEPTAVPLVTFSEWLLEEGFPSGSGPQDDSNGNGVPNLLHYFFGNPEGRSNISEVRTNGANFSWSFAVPRDVTGVTMISRITSDLSADSWEIGPIPSLASTNGTHRIYTVTVPLSENPLFIRLEFQLE